MNYPVDYMLDILDVWMRQFDYEIDVDPDGGCRKIHLYTSRNGNKYQVGADQRDSHWDVYRWHDSDDTRHARFETNESPTYDATFALMEMLQLADDAATIFTKNSN